MKAGSSAGGMKETLLKHVEKLVLGVACVLVALLLWSALGVKPIDASKSPDRLKTEATQEIARIDASEPPPEPPASRKDFTSAVLAGLQPITDTSAYSHPVKIDPELQPAIVKRPEPTYFPVEDVRATPVIASIAVAGTAPTWAEPTKEKEKKKAVKREPKYNPDADGPRAGRRRGARTGYGESSEMFPRRPTAAAKKAAGADQDTPGYGQPGANLPHGPGSRVGYGTAADTDSRYPAGYGVGPTMGGPHPGTQVVGAQAQGEVRHAVVVTGRVPYAKQFEEFQKKFKEAVPPDNYSQEMDFPKYYQFKVERQEVTANGEGKWAEVDLEAAWKAEDTWLSVATQDPVDPTYIYNSESGGVPVLAWPMPPAIQRDWLRLATHPSIPLAGMDMDVTQTTGTLRDTTQERSRRWIPRPGEGMDTDLGNRLAPTRDGAFGVGPLGGAVDQPAVAHVPSYLFRFVDSEKLEPGKQYRYRVSVELVNPNFGVSPGLLEDPSSTRQEGRWTPASEPTAAVTIPRDRTLIALKNKGNSPTDQEVQVLFHIWDKKMGAEIAKEFPALGLGGLADFVATVEDWYNPYTGMAEKLENVTFRYEDGPPMLADVDGGTGLPGARGVEQPTEALFIDAKGRLFTSNEAFDAATAEFYKERYVSAAAAPADATDGSILDPGITVPKDFGGRR